LISLIYPLAIAIEYLNEEQAFFGINVQTKLSGYIDKEYEEEKVFTSFCSIGTFRSLAFFKIRFINIIINVVSI
jgi:hypothetical protein|tara:strand:+ start:121 stop:342 length:222 start_codon:yes stop_codon:yes gene_type:complete